MDHVARLYRVPHIPDALTAPEVNVIRAAIVRGESAADHISGPKPDGQLSAIVEVMLDTSARVGECWPSVAGTSTHQRCAIHPPGRHDREPKRRADLPEGPPPRPQSSVASWHCPHSPPTRSATSRNRPSRDLDALLFQSRDTADHNERARAIA
jgi:hypothetical protein